MNTVPYTRSVALLLAIAATLASFAFTSIAFAQSPNGFGYGNDRVEVCRATGSRFFPYTKVTVPEFVAERWIAQDRAVYPVGGECPAPEKTLRDYIRDRVSNIFGRIFG